MLLIIWCIVSCIGVITVNAESWDQYCKCWVQKVPNHEYTSLGRCIKKIYDSEQSQIPTMAKYEEEDCWDIEKDTDSLATFEFKNNAPACKSRRTYKASIEVLKDIRKLLLPAMDDIVHVIKLLFKLIEAGDPCETWLKTNYPEQLDLNEIYTALAITKDQPFASPENCGTLTNLKSKLAPWAGKRPKNLLDLVLRLCREGPSSKMCSYLLVFHIAETVGKNERSMVTYPVVCDAFRILLIYYDFHLTSKKGIGEGSVSKTTINIVTNRVLRRLSEWVKSGIKDDRIEFYYHSLSFPQQNALLSNAEKFCGDENKQTITTSLLCQLLNAISKLVESLKELFFTEVKVIDTELDYKKYLTGEEIKGSLDEKLEQLGTYLSKVQEFERKKAKNDIKYVRNRLVRYGETLNQLSKDLGHTLFAIAESARAMAIVNLGVKTGVAMVATSSAAANPLFSTGTLNAMKAWSDVTTAVSDQIDVEFLKITLSDVETLSADIKRRFAKSMKILLKADKYVDPKREQHERFTIDDDARNFLNVYGNYNPGVQKNEIENLIEFWKSLFEKGCAKLQKVSGHAPGAILMNVAIKKGWCTKHKGQIEQLRGLLLEMYDFQRKFLESSALYLRSKLGEANAATLGKRVEEVENTSNLKKEELVMLGTLIYKMSIQEILHRYCVSYEYRDGGVKPRECQGKSIKVRNVIILKQPTRRPLMKLINLPETRWSTDDRTAISMESLFNGEDVFFQIPSYDWLMKTKQFQSIGRDDSYYVKAIGIYLPYVSSSHSVLTRAEVVGESVLKENGQKYKFLRPYITRFEYKEGVNQQSCPTEVNKNRYTICNANPLPKYCQVSSLEETDCNDEKMTTPFPSIYSKWKINVFGYENYQESAQETKVDIKAVLVLCHQTATRRNIPSKRSTNGIPDKTCCYGDSYFDTDLDRCETCPKKSKGALHGYYCRKNPVQGN